MGTEASAEKEKPLLQGLLSVTIRWKGDLVEGGPREASSPAEDRIATAVQKAVDWLTQSSKEGPTGPTATEAAPKGRQKRPLKTPVTPAPDMTGRCFGCGRFGHKIRTCVYNPKKNKGTSPDKGAGVDEGTQIPPQFGSGETWGPERTRTRVPFFAPRKRITPEPLYPAGDEEDDDVDTGAVLDQATNLLQMRREKLAVAMAETTALEEALGVWHKLHEMDSRERDRWQRERELQRRPYGTLFFEPEAPEARFPQCSGHPPQGHHQGGVPPALRGLEVRNRGATTSQEMEVPQATLSRPGRRRQARSLPSPQTHIGRGGKTRNCEQERPHGEPTNWIDRSPDNWNVATLATPVGGERMKRKPRTGPDTRGCVVPRSWKS